MTAPDPPAVAGMPAEAVEAAAPVLYGLTYGDISGYVWIKELASNREFWRRQVTKVLAAALPHLRAQILAEVDAALRDDERIKDWLRRGGMDRRAIGFPAAADYLRDTLAGDGGEAP